MLYYSLLAITSPTFSDILCLFLGAFVFRTAQTLYMEVYSIDPVATPECLSSQKCPKPAVKLKFVLTLGEIK
jgi:hypothetical protein